tara:strand:+ start:3187 stop:4392 length:1206 start_codon:yes stop_codon:yes gene_type:complete
VAVGKVNDVAGASIGKVQGVAAASIGKLSDVAASLGEEEQYTRLAMVVGESAEVYWTTSSTINSMEDWTLLDLGSGGYDSVKWGHDSDGNEVWIIARDSASDPMYIAVSDGSTNWVPSASANWVSVRPDGGRQLDGKGHRVSYGNTGSDDQATWMLASVGESEYAYYVSGSITDPSNWEVVFRGFDGSSQEGSFRPMLWNREEDDEKSTFLIGVNNPGELWASANGTGSGDNNDWMEVDGGFSGNSKNKGAAAYSQGKWVVLGQQSAEHHRIGEGFPPTTWADLNEPAANRQMLSIATDMTGTMIAVGKNSYVWRSFDNGDNWEEIRVTGSNAGVYRTWRGIAYDNNMLNEDGGGTWLVAGSGGDFMVSTDNGENWHPFSISDSTNRQYNAVAFNCTGAYQ